MDAPQDRSGPRCAGRASRPATPSWQAEVIAALQADEPRGHRQRHKAPAKPVRVVTRNAFTLNWPREATGETSRVPRPVELLARRRRGRQVVAIAAIADGIEVPQFKIHRLQFGVQGGGMSQIDESELTADDGKALRNNRAGEDRGEGGLLAKGLARSARLSEPSVRNCACTAGCSS